MVIVGLFFLRPPFDLFDLVSLTMIGLAAYALWVMGFKRS
jgi:hypothetical protein